jgi:hypothetical protein
MNPRRKNILKASLREAPPHPEVIKTKAPKETAPVKVEIKVEPVSEPARRSPSQTTRKKATTRKRKKVATSAK